MDEQISMMDYSAAAMSPDSTSLTQPGALFNVPYLDRADFYELSFRFLFNLVVAVVIIRCIYYRFHKKNDHLFTFFILDFFYGDR